jgi:hypothetical protein
MEYIGQVIQHYLSPQLGSGIFKRQHQYLNCTPGVKVAKVARLV